MANASFLLLAHWDVKGPEDFSVTPRSMLQIAKNLKQQGPITARSKLLKFSEHKTKDALYKSLAEFFSTRTITYHGT